MDKGIEIEGKLGNIQGYGLTEFGVRGKLLEANVSIISNNDCVEALRYNLTDNSVARKQIDQALPQGLSYGLLCARGEKINENVYRGSCKGDSGGPLTTKDDKDRTTLVGIVSGGIGCGKGYPGWYTKVAFHSEWVQCIVEAQKTISKKEDIMRSCDDAITKPKKCQEIDPDEQIFGDLRTIDDDSCNEDGTFATETLYQPVTDPIYD